ncbi:MAG: type VI secretion system protein TssA [Methylosarcina sp.]
MDNFTLEEFLKEISPELPCGQNLENDFAFAQLEDEARGKKEIQMGDQIIPEVPPDWKKVRTSAFELLARSRDIQVAMHLTCALLHTDGMAGMVQGLAIIHGLLEKYWNEVYPRQDPEDEYPILRINILGTLKDFKKILDPIARTPLTQSKIGNFSWHDKELVQESLHAAAKNEEIPDLAIIEAAFLDTPMDYLKQQLATINQARQLTEDIVDLVTDKIGSIYSVDILPLIKLLKSMGQFLEEKIQQHPEPELAESAGNVELAGEVSRSGTPSTSGGIHNREDVIRSIDAICKYFERYEPSSPVPFLLLRAKKMLAMNFMEIILELAPDAVNQAETICGVQKQK